MQKLSWILLICVVLAPVRVAYAGPDYSAADIVDLFKPGSAPATRSVFLGATGYGDPNVAARDDERFNLLVTFAYNSDQLTIGAMRNLDEFAQALNDPQLKTSRFVVEGHTDATGSDAYNLVLSEKRAAAVVAFLIGKGVLASRLVAKGFGERRLLSERPDDPINRRVETRLIE